MSYSTLWISLGVTALLLFLYNFLFCVFHEHLIFQGSHLEDDYEFDFNFQFEEIRLSPSTEVQLHGLLLRNDEPKGLIIYFHGNRDHVDRWGRIANKIRENSSYDILVMDNRGYGKSRGPRTEKNLYQDAEYIYDYASTNYQYDRIIIHGRSLGTAIATYLATQRKADHLILETPMTRIREVIPILDKLLINKSWLTYEFNSISRIENINCPITIFHGTEDQVVPYELGYQLYVKISHSRKKIITINGGKHNNLDTFDSYQQALEQILEY